VVTADLRFGDQGTSAIFGKSLVAASAPKAPIRPTAAICPHCSVVEAVNVIEVKGDGSYLGLIAGGLAGGLLGSRVGQGSGISKAEVVGAMGGAYAGREIEKNVKKTKHYEAIVRLQGGGTRAVSYEAEPGFRMGDKVRVVNGTLVRDQ
jgi:outer membrane lipoprotein SlyB